MRAQNPGLNETTVKQSVAVEEIHVPDEMERCCDGRHDIADVAELDEN